MALYNLTSCTACTEKMEHTLAPKAGKAATAANTTHLVFLSPLGQQLLALILGAVRGVQPQQELPRLGPYRRVDAGAENALPQHVQTNQPTCHQ